MAVDTPSVQYERMKTEGSWDLCQALLKGTPGMRAGTTTWLPQEPDEKDEKYAVRLKRSFLHNAYKNTIEQYVARPFSRPAQWDVENDEAKLALEPIMNDMDGEGQHHQAFAKELLRMLLRWGVQTTFVDYPEVDDPDSKSKQDETDEELRPVNRLLKTPAIIGWTLQEQKNGTEKVVEIRVKEVYVEDADDWTQIVYEQIRVIRADSWQLWRRKKKNNATDTEEAYTKEDEGTILIAGKTPTDLPIVTAYTDKTGLLQSLPPFLEMAWTNLELWQSMSDQKNILRFDRFGILMGSGFTEDEISAGLTVAPTQAILSENPEAKLSRVETNGKPAENGWKDIRDIFERLEIQGMNPMIQRLANVKATGLSQNESKSRSQMESWVDEANLAMRKVMQLNLKWMGFDIPLDQIDYSIHQDFVFTTQQSQEVKDVIEARKMGEISSETFLKEMQRYGRLSDMIDPIEERARALAEQGNGVGLFNENVEAQRTTPIPPAASTNVPETKPANQTAEEIIAEQKRRGGQQTVGANI